MITRVYFSKGNEMKGIGNADVRDYLARTSDYVTASKEEVANAVVYLSGVFTNIKASETDNMYKAIIGLLKVVISSDDNATMEIACDLARTLYVLRREGIQLKYISNALIHRRDAYVKSLKAQKSPVTGDRTKDGVKKKNVTKRMTTVEDVSREMEYIAKLLGVCKAGDVKVARRKDPVIDVKLDSQKLLDMTCDYKDLDKFRCFAKTACLEEVLYALAESEHSRDYLAIVNCIKTLLGSGEKVSVDVLFGLVKHAYIIREKERSWEEFKVSMSGCYRSLYGEFIRKRSAELKKQKKEEVKQQESTYTKEEVASAESAMDVLISTLKAQNAVSIEEDAKKARQAIVSMKKALSEEEYMHAVQVIESIVEEYNAIKPIDVYALATYMTAEDKKEAMRHLLSGGLGKRISDCNVIKLCGLQDGLQDEYVDELKSYINSLPDNDQVWYTTYFGYDLNRLAEMYVIIYLNEGMPQDNLIASFRDMQKVCVKSSVVFNLREAILVTSIMD